MYYTYTICIITYTVFRAMMNSFDQRMPFAYTPGEKFLEVQDLWRKSIIGGITNVYRIVYIIYVT